MFPDSRLSIPPQWLTDTGSVPRLGMTLLGSSGKTLSPFTTPVPSYSFRPFDDTQVSFRSSRCFVGWQVSSSCHSVAVVGPHSDPGVGLRVPGKPTFIPPFSPSHLSEPPRTPRRVPGLSDVDRYKYRLVPGNDGRPLFTTATSGFGFWGISLRFYFRFIISRLLVYKIFGL